LRAFFLFSAPVAAPPVAALLTALEPVRVGATAIPMPTVGPALPPTFASAVLRGDGDAWRSLFGEATPSFSEGRSLEGGAGDADFRVTIGRVNIDEEDVDGVDVCVGGAGAVLLADVEPEDDASGSGVSNSMGRVRGVA